MVGMTCSVLSLAHVGYLLSLRENIHKLALKLS